MTLLQARLFDLRDAPYADFTRKLIPNIPPETVIGVRVPALRKLAREVDAAALFSDLPHAYHEENMLHAILLSAMREAGAAETALVRFLPHVTNWAVCDILAPKCFRRVPERAIPFAYRCMESTHAYTVRFGLVMLLQFFLKEHFSEETLRRAAAVQSEDYYVKMAVAWLFSVALVYEEEAALPYVRALPADVRRMTVRKAKDSFRLSPAQKSALDGLTGE